MYLKPKYKVTLSAFKTADQRHFANWNAGMIESPYIYILMTNIIGMFLHKLNTHPHKFQFLIDAVNVFCS